MKVSELITELQKYNNNDDVLLRSSRELEVKEYLGQVFVIEQGYSDKFEEDYERYRWSLNKQEIKYQDELDNVRSKKDKLKPKPSS